MRPRNDLDAVGALSDPLRRRLYRLVASATEPVTRDAAAAALDIPRSTAAFHLERLVDAGALEASSSRPPGRTGPGAGRPARLYTVPEHELLASVPDRQYHLAGDLLAAAAEQADADGVPVRDALPAVARRAGEQLAEASDSLESALTGCGYEPQDDGEGGLTLQNCPFHLLAQRHTDLVCAANLCLIEGMVAATGDARHPALEPHPGRCCVAVHSTPTPTDRR
jgi:predicted ArsR family transcriptional regulator